MPSKTCSVCNEKVVILQKDWKYIHSSTDFICSKECLLARIKSFSEHYVVGPNYSSAPALDSSQLSRASSRILGLSFRSEFEAAVAEYLHSCALKFLYEPYIFDVDGHSYTPDFYIKGLNQWHEVKGFLTDKAKEKMEIFKNEYPKETLCLIDEKVLHTLGVL